MVDYDKLLVLLQKAQVKQSKDLEHDDVEHRRVAQVVVEALSKEYTTVGRMKAATQEETYAQAEPLNMEVKDGKVFVDGVETDEVPEGVKIERPNRALRRAKK